VHNIQYLEDENETEFFSFRGRKLGTALATLLGNKGFQVVLWVRDPGQRDTIFRTRENRKYFTEFLFLKM
jgi:glycerol-3-phosphate dehydrogenase